MKGIISHLNGYKNEIEFWLKNPSVSAPLEPMKKILLEIELAIEIINSNRKITVEEKDFFNGNIYLARYFDGWGEIYYDPYLEMIKYIKENHS